HGREKRDNAPQLEPFSSQEFVGDLELASQNFVVVGGLGVLLKQLLIFSKGLFILAKRFQAATGQILSLRRVIGKRPHADDAPRGFEREAVSLFVEGGLRDVQLILGASHLPFAFAPDRLVGPAFARAVNQGRGRAKRDEHNQQCDY